MECISNEPQPSSSRKRHAPSTSQYNSNNSIPSNNDHVITNRSGKILRIHLKNFMCHSNLVMDFNRRVNFIVGGNGTGKSSILKALAVGLGTKPWNMNIKQLIKTGEMFATIEIVIDNGGKNSFEHSTYGDKITIICHITDKGSFYYNITNEWGRIISNHIDDLKKILLYYNIQVDNPVFGLSHDRSFLNELDPDINYQLFLKVIELEINLKGGFDLYNDSKYHLGLHKMQNESLKQQVHELSKEYEILHTIKDIKENIKRFKLERLWNQVAEQEEFIENLQNEISLKINQKNELLLKMQNNNEAEKESQNNIRKLEEDLKEKNIAIIMENQTLQTLKDELTRENDQYSIEQRMCTKLERNINYLKEQALQLQSNIEERSQSSAHIRKLRENNAATMAGLNANMKEIQDMIFSLKQELELQNQRNQQILQQCENIKRQKEEMYNQISDLQKELERLVISEKDKNLLYGNYMNAILKEIEKANDSRLFKFKPLGPVGKYINVPNEKWLTVVEKLLGEDILTAFLVDNSSDRDVLDKIMKEKFPNINMNVITLGFENKIYDVGHGTVIQPKGTTLLMNEIKCFEPNVMNCLIDTRSIEAILLTEDQNLAEQLTKNVKKVPKNLLKVIVLEPYLEYYAAPLYSVKSNTLGPIKYLNIDIPLKKKEIEIEINECYQTISNCDAQMDKFNEEMIEFKGLLQQIKTKFRTNQEEFENKMLQLNELKNFKYPKDHGTEFLEKELLSVQENLRSTERQLDVKQKNCTKCFQNKIDKERVVNKQKELIRSLEESIPQIKTECDNFKLQYYAQQNDFRRYDGILKQLEMLISVAENELNEEFIELEKYKEKAQEMGDRVHSSRTVEELENLIRIFEGKLQHTSHINGNIEDIEILLAQKRSNLKTNEELVEAATENLCSLKKSHIERIKKIENVKCLMELKLKYSFEEYLKHRQFSGEIIMDHVNEKLTIKVIPRHNHVRNAILRMELLSSEERSFTVTAFLLSLWACVDHPFYFLDEYDICTDQVNRHIITRLLLNEAEKNPQRQYIFLTPQDIYFNEASEKITIHRLQSPRD